MSECAAAIAASPVSQHKLALVPIFSLRACDREVSKVRIVMGRVHAAVAVHLLCAVRYLAAELVHMLDV